MGLVFLPLDDSWQVAGGKLQVSEFQTDLFKQICWDWFFQDPSKVEVLINRPSWEFVSKDIRQKYFPFNDTTDTFMQRSHQHPSGGPADFSVESGDFQAMLQFIRG